MRLLVEYTSHGRGPAAEVPSQQHQVRGDRGGLSREH